MNESFKERRTLDQSSSVSGQAGSTADTARPFAELDPRRIQMGSSPIWINRGFSSAIRRDGPKMDSARPV
ncbi:hypothetical protein F2Q70_00013250 [Brassica cretica]|uniref:Uncharacterized protein n=1 Tax=Brassica cretica TaxID=69181 RepID=A0A3N6QQ50_BRACR|nr:hypothetical protein F2Q70_00021986 [Brassica cretica]KAF2596633.1 hypothetical protein F2Q68_00010244 [Brassica cretica]KAF2615060.1 hypothetical protein F2Q70_00013250 [Brassica cretica]